MHIFLFAGTSEGRRIAEAIARRTLRCRTSAPEEAASRSDLSAEIYVATDYGAQLLPEGPGVTVHTGRLRQEEMQEEFAEAVRRSAAIPAQGPVLVVDATHPYAVVVSENIRRACAALRLPCIRVQRLSAHPEAADSMHRVSSIEDAAEWLRTWAEEAGSAEDSPPAARPNILITTGSKELLPYTRIPDFAARCYVRALPTEAALSACRRLGFRQDHLILMQGPFSEDMNRAQLRYARAGVLVTKDSGETGGFPEKCEAAAAEHTALLVIGRPKEVSIPDASWYHIADLNEVLRLFQADRE